MRENNGLIKAIDDALIKEALENDKTFKAVILGQVVTIHQKMDGLPCKDHNKRVSDLENCKQQVKGGWGAIRTLFPLIGALIAIAIAIYSCYKVMGNPG